MQNYVIIDSMNEDVISFLKREIKFFRIRETFMHPNHMYMVRIISSFKPIPEYLENEIDKMMLIKGYTDYISTKEEVMKLFA